MAEVVRLVSLPVFAVFRTCASRLRGLLLRWYRARTGERREAMVLLLRGDRTERRRIGAHVMVEIEDRHARVNGSARPRSARVFEGFRPFLDFSGRRYAIPKRWRYRRAAPGWGDGLIEPSDLAQLAVTS